MFKVYEQVCKHILYGEKIASAIGCDYLITAGVSNWGAEALACGVYAHHVLALLAQSTAPSQQVDVLAAITVMPTLAQHYVIALGSGHFGAGDPFLHTYDGAADGIALEEHSKMFQTFNHIVLQTIVPLYFRQLFPKSKL
ncbi:hypothetical protein RFI_19143 [Reticulomyxa filosa]|uniref:D-glutamate cyclase-like C-terminal domain-containing protein n=1 Tax=Reticulomyxa filosa TaxID=46433 RepID=X6MYJ1_RETFI|nr:hypothetical protein RFI_19143 [Reticulomyxa filosa]|eukprot:ETO18145.1 hypothetical protein RFI_19143 [Reticulomyxa filosa]